LSRVRKREEVKAGLRLAARICAKIGDEKGRREAATLW
jgi:hypothetical protein